MKPLGPRKPNYPAWAVIPRDELPKNKNIEVTEFHKKWKKNREACEEHQARNEDPYIIKEVWDE